MALLVRIFNLPLQPLHPLYSSRPPDDHISLFFFSKPTCTPKTILTFVALAFTLTQAAPSNGRRMVKASALERRVNSFEACAGKALRDDCTFNLEDGRVIVGHCADPNLDGNLACGF
ncbi:hypothetical protein DL96DRAFT_1813158 [Flagelloscypha sp. PMI_526]|nr:hypothetical protein DL96DRAFT_1813158 [Flagelloscypha sp. PMI_526]